jgi:hypothetical protein
MHDDYAILNRRKIGLPAQGVATQHDRAEPELPTADIHDEPSHPDWRQGGAAEPRKT